MAGVLSQTKAIFTSTQQSGSVGSALSTFSRFKICFTSTPLTCGNGQVNVIKLINFSAHRNWYTVNKFNSKFIFRYVKSGGENVGEFNLTHKDYSSIGAVATEFRTQLLAALTTAQGSAFGVAADITPTANQNTGDTGKRSFAFNTTSSSTLTLSNIRVQFPQFSDTTDETDFNDSYVLLGGKRISDPTDTTTSSLKVTIAGNKITFQGAFPMQLHTQPYMYLSLNLSNDNLQTANLGNAKAASDQHVSSSCLLAKIAVQNNFCAAEFDESSPYYISTSQRSVTELLFQCLDSHGRQFPFIDDVGDGDDIEKSGNLFSDMVIRHEVKDIGSDGNVLNAPYKTYNYQVNTLGEAQLIGGGGF